MLLFQEGMGQLKVVAGGLEVVGKFNFKFISSILLELLWQTNSFIRKVTMFLMELQKYDEIVSPKIERLSKKCVRNYGTPTAEST